MIMETKTTIALLVAFLFVLTIQSVVIAEEVADTTEATTITIKTDKVQGAIAPEIYGQFIEHFGHATSDGLFAEKIRGRRFEGEDLKVFWQFFESKNSQGSCSRMSGKKKGIRLHASSGTIGIRQKRVSIQRGVEYAGHIKACVESGKPELSFVIRKRSGMLLEEIPVNLAGKTVHQIPFSFHASADEMNASVELAVSGPGSVCVESLSLMSDADKKNGMFRKDLRDAIAALRPTFIRYPGGGFASFYHWQDGIGPQDLRPYRKNLQWKYHHYNEFGTDEFMELCRQVNAQPLIVLNASDRSIQDPEAAGVLLADAVNWIAYLNSPAESKWGKKRARNGHPHPYKVKYFQIDNEPMDWGNGGNGPAYADIVNIFGPGLRKAAPGAKIIACGQKRSYDMAFSQAVIDEAGMNFDILGVHNYEYEEEAFFTGVRRIGNYLVKLRDYIKRSKYPHIKIGVLEWGMSRGHSSMDWRSGLHAAGILMLYESLTPDISMSCPAVFLRQKGFGVWGYGAHIMFDHTTWWPSGSYVVGKLFRDYYEPQLLAYVTGKHVDAIATRSVDKKRIVVKAVNYSGDSSELTLDLKGPDLPAGANVEVVEIAVGLKTECSSHQPGLFTPSKKRLPYSRLLKYSLKPYSVVIFEISGDGKEQD